MTEISWSSCDGSMTISTEYIHSVDGALSRVQLGFKSPPSQGLYYIFIYVHLLNRCTPVENDNLVLMVESNMRQILA